MSMRLHNLVISEIKYLTTDVYELTLTGDDFSDCTPGQFINIKIDGVYLRRPISICNASSDTLIITYKVLGQGTKLLSKLKIDDQINCLYPLGTSIELPDKKDVLIVAGGIGVPPMVGIYEMLVAHDYNVRTVIGFKNQDQVIYQDKFNDCEVSLDEIDGNIINYLDKNNVSDDYYIYSCGPTRMLEALASRYDDGQLLLEERMGCGFGACMGCSKQISDKTYKRVCVEGPVFTCEEVRYGIK